MFIKRGTVKDTRIQKYIGNTQEKDTIQIKNGHSSRRNNIKQVQYTSTVRLVITVPRRDLYCLFDLRIIFRSIIKHDTQYI